MENEKLIARSGLTEDEFIKKYLPNGYIYKGFLFSHVMHPKNIATASKFKFRPTDVLITTYPKSGTHWMCEIVSRLMFPEESKSTQLLDRVPYLNSFKYFDPNDSIRDSSKLPSDISVAEFLATVPISQRRIFKAHQAPSFYETDIFDAKPKIVYCTRNPFDVAVSYYNFYKKVPALGPFKGTWDEFFEMYMNGYVCVGDYFEHMLEWEKYKDYPNVLVVQYETVIENPIREIRRIAEFLNLERQVTNEFISDVARNCSFASMEENPLVNNYATRKGIVGDWKNYFNESQKERVLARIKEKLETCGIPIQYE